MLLRDEAQFDLAVRVRGPGASLGEVFQFLSGLYFRGKLGYALAFARPPRGIGGVWIITPSSGLVVPETRTSLGELHTFAGVAIDAAEPRYREPLSRTAAVLSAALSANAEVVLLGSVATGKYLDVLGPIFGDRLRFPAEFVGRGDMSRGGLLLRSVRAGTELAYRPIGGASRRGARPAKLEKLPAAAKRSGPPRPPGQAGRRRAGGARRRAGGPSPRRPPRRSP